MKISNACLQNNEQIENRRGEKEEGEEGMEETHVHTFEKCYIGFCTATHTEMDSKKKKEQIDDHDGKTLLGKRTFC